MTSKMYVTRPLSSYKRSPENLALPPPEGPNSGFLVVFDEVCETTTCFGLCKNKSVEHLPFPQSKDLTVWYTEHHREISITTYYDVLFIPVLDQPLSSNRYYVIQRQGKRKGLRTYFGICNFYIFSDLLDQIIIILQIIKIANDMTMTVVYNVYRSSTLFFVSML